MSRFVEERMKALLQRLCRARDLAGLSPAQVDKRLELSCSTTTAIEAGEAGDQPLTVEQMLAMCEIYDADETWVLTGINPYFDATRFAQLIDSTKGYFNELLELGEMSRQERPLTVSPIHELQQRITRLQGAVESMRASLDMEGIRASLEDLGLLPDDLPSMIAERLASEAMMTEIEVERMNGADYRS